MIRLDKPSKLLRRTQMSYGEFLTRYISGERLEWVDGEVVPMPPISGPHNSSSISLLRWIGEWVEHFDLGEIRADPFQMKTGADLPGRTPDLIFVAKRNLKRLHTTHLEGPADLVVEIISPKTKTIDRVDKFSEYQAGGVREYWIIDPKARSAEFYQLSRNGVFQLVEPSDGIYQCLTIRGLWLRVDWLWSPPKLDLIRKEWGLR